MGIHFKVRGVHAGNDSWGRERFLAYVEIQARHVHREKMIAKEGRNERMNEYAFHSLGGMELVVTRPFEKGFAARSVCNFQQGRLKCRVEEGMQKMRFAGTSVCTEITGFRC